MKADYPSVLLIYTGGTIGMIENPETGALENFNFAHLLKHVPELKRFNYHISSYQFDPPIDSSDMEPSLWAKIVAIINDNYENFDGFVILHGTDTMAYTASALSFMLENLAKPVILTGSQLPIGTLRTDGKENLITSIEIAAAKRPDARQPDYQNQCRKFQRFPLFQLPRSGKSRNPYPLQRTHHPSPRPCTTDEAALSFRHQCRSPHPVSGYSGKHHRFCTSRSGIESSGSQNIRFRQCTAKGLVHPATEGRNRTRHRHCQHYPMPKRRC